MSNHTSINAHIADIMCKLEKVGTRCGCWYVGDDTGFISGNISGSMVTINNESGYGYIEITPETWKNLCTVVGRDGAKSLLSKERRLFEERVRKDRLELFEYEFNLFLGEWMPSEYAKDKLIEGIPTRYYREKPSSNGNGWWAGDKLVHEYATKSEVREIRKIARRRFEDRIRKDPEFFLQII